MEVTEWPEILLASGEILINFVSFIFETDKQGMQGDYLPHRKLYMLRIYGLVIIGKVNLYRSVGFVVSCCCEADAYIINCTD